MVNMKSHLWFSYEKYANASEEQNESLKMVAKMKMFYNKISLKTS